MGNFVSTAVAIAVIMLKSIKTKELRSLSRSKAETLRFLQILSAVIAVSLTARRSTADAIIQARLVTITVNVSTVRIM